MYPVKICPLNAAVVDQLYGGPMRFSNRSTISIKTDFSKWYKTQQQYSRIFPVGDCSVCWQSMRCNIRYCPLYTLHNKHWNVCHQYNTLFYIHYRRWDWRYLTVLFIITCTLTLAINIGMIQPLYKNIYFNLIVVVCCCELLGRKITLCESIKKQLYDWPLFCHAFVVDYYFYLISF